jgi:hypothetical protein
LLDHIARRKRNNSYKKGIARIVLESNRKWTKHFL